MPSTAWLMMPNSMCTLLSRTTCQSPARAPKGQGHSDPYSAVLRPLGSEMLPCCIRKVPFQCASCASAIFPSCLSSPGGSNLNVQGLTPQEYITSLSCNHRNSIRKIRLLIENCIPLCPQCEGEGVLKHILWTAHPSQWEGYRMKRLSLQWMASQFLFDHTVTWKWFRDRGYYTASERVITHNAQPHPGSPSLRTGRADLWVLVSVFDDYV